MSSSSPSRPGGKASRASAKYRRCSVCTVFGVFSGLFIVLANILAWAPLYHYNGTWNLERSRAYFWTVPNVLPRGRGETHYKLVKFLYNNFHDETFETYERCLKLRSRNLKQYPPPFLWVPGTSGHEKQVLNIAEWYLSPFQNLSPLSTLSFQSMLPTTHHL